MPVSPVCNGGYRPSQTSEPKHAGDLVRQTVGDDIAGFLLVHAGLLGLDDDAGPVFLTLRLLLPTLGW